MTIWWCVKHGCGEARPAPSHYVCELRLHHPADFPGDCEIVEATLDLPTGRSDSHAGGE